MRSFVNSNDVAVSPDRPLHPVKQYFLDHALDFRIVPSQPQCKPPVSGERRSVR